VRRNSAKKPKRPVFDRIRKPTAPSTKRFGDDRPDERIHPAQRKVKHKDKRDRQQMNNDDQ
jgi:hypothetical protein